MKFVAQCSFHNAPELNLKLDEDASNFEHKLQVPKGHRFEIAPEAKAIKGVTREADKQLIAKLVMFNMAVVDDGTPESKDAITKIDSEVKAANAADKLAEARKPLSVSDQIALGVASALKQLNAKV
ncbi:MAG: hypothetical protein KGJ13_05825 [Patescibacteria group bacterium]|nr:hypothetical protein [Patescibacteria group bacterium]